MATVITPAGERLEGVVGDLLTYYRAEGYEIQDELPAEPAQASVVGEQGPELQTSPLTTQPVDPQPDQPTLVPDQPVDVPADPPRPSPRPDPSTP